MNRKEEFDQQIKILSNIDKNKFGYKIKDKKIYEFYLSNDAWKDFLEEIKTKYKNIYDCYVEGKGGELEEKNSRYGLLPPKMASIASSSRFIYLLFRYNREEKIKQIVKDIEKNGTFTFEDKLEIDKIKSQPNLDATYITEKKTIYFEAKCHELFDSHKLEWKESYFQNGIFYGNSKKSLNINKQTDIELCNGEPKKYKKTEHNKIVLYCKIKNSTFDFDEEEKLYLDVKQFVCHLLGIANDEKSEDKKRELVYLYFKPKSLSGFDNEYKSLEKQFKTFCECQIISSFCDINNIALKLVYAINNSMLDKFEPKIIYTRIPSKK